MLQPLICNQFKLDSYQIASLSFFLFFFRVFSFTRWYFVENDNLNLKKIFVNKLDWLVFQHPMFGTIKPDRDSFRFLKVQIQLKLNTYTLLKHKHKHLQHTHINFLHFFFFTVTSYIYPLSGKTLFDNFFGEQKYYRLNFFTGSLYPLQKLRHVLKISSFLSYILFPDTHVVNI